MNRERRRGCGRSKSVWTLKEEEEQPEVLVFQQVALCVCSLTVVDVPDWRMKKRRKRSMSEGGGRGGDFSLKDWSQSSQCLATSCLCH